MNSFEPCADCGGRIDPALCPSGMCPDCEARNHRINEEAWRDRP